MTKYIFSLINLACGKEQHHGPKSAYSESCTFLFRWSCGQEKWALGLKRTLSERCFHQETARVVSGFSVSSRDREIRKCRRSGKADVGPWCCSFPHSQPFLTYHSYINTAELWTISYNLFSFKHLQNQSQPNSFANSLYIFFIGPQKWTK